MGDDGGDVAPVPATTIAQGHSSVAALAAAPVEVGKEMQATTMPVTLQDEEVLSPGLPPGVNPLVRRATSLDLDDYFKGPRDMDRHSRVPLFLRVHGSILPKMVIPLLWLAAWSTAITLICELVHDISVGSVLLTITGFVVGLGLSFRGSTAYERYSEGRKYWAQIMLASQNLGRVLWVHSKDKDPALVKKHMLHTMTASNMVVAFAIALKHKLRFQPYTGYDDISHLVAHLQTFAGEATKKDPSKSTIPRNGMFKEVAEWLGLRFAVSNPRKALKEAEAPLGNLPLEILTYLSLYMDKLIADGKLTVSIYQTLAFNNISILNDALIGTERVLSTPLPIAYNIAFNQITWVYVTVLPFQLWATLGWVTIPATIVASYIILGLLFIGQELENPFGADVNDLPLETYCEQVAANMDVVAAQAMDFDRVTSLVEGAENRVLFPASSAPFPSWMLRSEETLKDAIRNKPLATFEAKTHHKHIHLGDGDGLRHKPKTDEVLV